VVVTSFSAQHWIDSDMLDPAHTYQSPPLSHCSDMTFLESKRACTKYNTNLKTLKHTFIAMVQTHATQEVVNHILGRTGYDWSTLPAWPQRHTFQTSTIEGETLLGTVQLKTIMWMLIQHREHLGKKAVKTISVFKDDMTGGSGAANHPEGRGPAIYIELEDIQ
jgi:hypothetical protein